MPDKMPEDMPDKMPEDLPVTKRIDVMVGITRSKVIYVLHPSFYLAFALSFATWTFREKRNMLRKIRVFSRKIRVFLRKNMTFKSSTK